VCKALYKVSHHIAHCNEAHAIALHQGHTLLCNNHLKVIKKIQLSNFTVSRIIDSISCNTERELIKRIKAVKGFATQVDESADFGGLPVLFASVRYIHKN
jgi:hypothetical protein